MQNTEECLQTNVKESDLWVQRFAKKMAAKYVTHPLGRKTLLLLVLFSRFM